MTAFLEQVSPITPTQPHGREVKKNLFYNFLTAMFMPRRASLAKRPILRNISVH